MKVTFTVPQYPGQTFNATLVASAGAVVSATGTMLVQFAIDNSDGTLQPGAYAEVKLPLPAGANGIRVPATALMFRDRACRWPWSARTARSRLKTGEHPARHGRRGGCGSGSIAAQRPHRRQSRRTRLQDGDTVRVARK